MLNKIIENYPDETILRADGFDDAVIGIDDSSMRLIYSVNKCIDMLIENDGMSEDLDVMLLRQNNFYIFGTITMGTILIIAITIGSI